MRRAGGRNLPEGGLVQKSRGRAAARVIQRNHFRSRQLLR